MKKFIYACMAGLYLFAASTAGAADVKVSALPETTTMAATDVFYIVTGMGSTPVSKRISATNLFGAIPVPVATAASNGNNHIGLTNNTSEPSCVGSFLHSIHFYGASDAAAKAYICINGTAYNIQTVKNEKLASFAWDGGGSAVATSGSKRCVAIPYAATIVGYTMVISGDPGAGGSILNITKDAWSDSTLPTTEIDASAPPTVADNKVASTDSTLTGWTKTVAANDIICADVATNAVATWISLTIFGTK